MGPFFVCIAQEYLINYLRIQFGGIAQLGERLHGMQEVSSSILLISTKFLHISPRDNGGFSFLP
jgi:hypothetical protein